MVSLALRYSDTRRFHRSSRCCVILLKCVQLDSQKATSGEKNGCSSGVHFMFLFSGVRLKSMV